MKFNRICPVCGGLRRGGKTTDHTACSKILKAEREAAEAEHDAKAASAPRGSLDCLTVAHKKRSVQNRTRKAYLTGKVRWPD